MRKILFLIIVGSFLVTTQAFGHSGGTDRWGCHHDHKRGGYHCHNKPDTPSPEEAKKIKDEKKEHKGIKIKKIKINIK